MSESDYVFGIFNEKIYNDDLQIALRYEINNNWAAARETYSKMIKKPDARDYLYLKDFCYESYFQCFDKLLHWDSLNDNIIETIGDYDNVWNNEWNQIEVLPWVIKTQTYNMCHSIKSQFPNKLQTWLKFNDKSGYLERNFSEYLVIYSIW